VVPEKLLGMTKVVRVFALALLVTAALPAPADAAWDLRCRSARNFVYTFTVETEWQKRVYAPGDKAKLTVTITRPAPEDPAGLGVPLGGPSIQPADGVDVSTAFQGFFPYVFDRSTTNTEGKVNLTLKLPKKTKPGPIDAYTYASKVHNANGPACSDVEEYGFRWDIPAIKVR